MFHGTYQLSTLKKEENNDVSTIYYTIPNIMELHKIIMNLNNTIIQLLFFIYFNKKLMESQTRFYQLSSLPYGTQFSVNS